MKSIKEKSNEYAREYLFSPLPQRAPNVHFEAGANYVLEEIESLMKNVSDEYPIYLQGTIIQGRLIKLLEQLKK